MPRRHPLSNRPLRARPSAALTAAALAALLTGCGMAVRATWPDRAATARSPALTAPVKIYLDPLGVPHIFAANDDDAAFAVGYMHGRDRRFQAEMIRHAAQGRLTEVLGQSMLDVDRRLRLLSWQLDEAVSNLPPDDRRQLEAYCAGLNQAAQESPRPLEMKLLGFNPLPWTVKDVMAIGRLQAWDLSADASLEAVRDRIAAIVPADVMSWMLEPSPSYGVSIIGGDAAKRPALPKTPETPAATALISPFEGASGTSASASQALPGASPLPDASPSLDASPEAVRLAVAGAVGDWLEHGRGGSNSWAVAGAHTEDGKPLLAGDPHLDLPFPAIFHEVHVHTPEVDYSGATFPGMPMVVIGRAGDVAWTLTTSYADAQDLYKLDVDPADPMKYRLDGQSTAFQAWPQTFKWGDKPDEQKAETFRVSKFGPVYNAGREERLQPGVTYALAWPGFGSGSLPITGAFGKLYRAKTPAEAMAAIEMLPIPSQNWTFATSDGHIGYILGGKLPARRASPLPRDGSTSASAWTGWLTSNDRPKLVDPPSGFIVASNQPVMADVQAYNTYGSGGYRSLRIATALESREKWTPGLLRGLQIDTVNLEAARTVSLLLDGFEKGRSTLESQPADRSKRTTAMADQLRAWDFRMQADSPAPLIYESWRGHLHHRLLRPHLKDPKVIDAALRERVSEAAMEVALFTPDGQRWWDDPATPAVEVREQAVLEALLAAEAELTAKFGQNPEKWSWGAAHTLTLAHPFATKSYLRPIFGQPALPASGGRHTIFALNHLGVVGEYVAESGPALRQVVRPGSEAGFVLPGGNAGQPKHAYSMNQRDDWMNGRQHLAGGDEKAVAAHAVGVIELSPAQ